MMLTVTWLFLALTLAGVSGLLPKIRRDHAPDLLIVAVLMAIAAWLRFRFVPFHHAMYVDEPWYEEAARNFLRMGELGINCSLRQTDGASAWACAEPYIKSAGWPAILVLAFKVAGVSDHTAFVTSALFGVAAVPATALATRAAGGKTAHVLLAAALVALLPVHIQWSATAETNVAAVTLLLLGLGGTLLYARSMGWAALLLALGGLGGAAAVRPELWLAFIPAAPLLFQRSWRTLVVVAGAALAAAPGVASRGAFSVHSKGELFQLSSLGENIRVWLTNQQELGQTAVVILILAGVGLYQAVRRGWRAPAILLGGTTLLIGGFVLFYYPPAGFYSRTMLGAMAPAAVLAGLYLPDRRPMQAMVGALVVTGVFGGWVWSARELWAPVSDSQLAETRLVAVSQSLSANALILAEQPTVLRATTDRHPMLLSQLAERPQLLEGMIAHSDHVYLACDMFCEPHFGGEDSSACAKVLRNFVVEPEAVVPGQHRNYGLYRLVRKSETPIENPVCPLIRD